MSTAAFFSSLREDFAAGAFLVPCVRTAEHWVCVGAWEEGRIGMVDSFFARPRLPRCKTSRRKTPEPELGFYTMSVEEFDRLDWPHHITLVRPGIWRDQFAAWLPARTTLLRMNLPQRNSRGAVSMVGVLRQAAHQFLDDHDYSYHRLHLRLRYGSDVIVHTDDPGGDAVGVEATGRRQELLVVRRLGGVLAGVPAAPELVIRASAVTAGHLAG